MICSSSMLLDLARGFKKKGKSFADCCVEYD